MGPLTVSRGIGGLKPGVFPAIWTLLTEIPKGSSTLGS
jgi:hypothetical protein